MNGRSGNAHMERDGQEDGRADRRGWFAVSAVGLTAALGLIGLAGGAPVAAVTALVVWGLAYGGVSVGLQTWMLRHASEVPEAATALWAAGLEYRHVVRLGTYVVDHDMEKLAVLGERVNALWEGRPPAQTLLGVVGLALPGMLFEVDALAVRD
ncbi:Rid family hydrolase [Nocardiopsis sp. CNR-923]|uniref:Rid family hydrolase n=1 Tax=Nocardiopsis sp. CNR-923 TaxID=1904965 RepID=UPI001650E705|nr:Rid family hydrolase [Nocardiopsis sp. CNR-923]